MPTETANFVLREYRVAEQKDDLVRAKFGAIGSREIAFDTNLSETAANALAVKVMADNADPLVFEMEVENSVNFEGFIGKPPQFAMTLTERNMNQRRVKVISTEMNLNTGKSKIEVRG